MTVLLAHVSADHAFLAADICRWDLVQNRKLPPVDKLHISKSSGAFVVGGSNIDRDEFALQLLTGSDQGGNFLDLARQCAPDLFQQKLELMREHGLNSPQLLIAYYAEARNGTCRIIRHQLSPETDYERAVDVFDCIGPDTPALSVHAQGVLPKFVNCGGLALDAWAFDVIGHCAKNHPKHVAYPAMAVMIRPDGSLVSRSNLAPDSWYGARPEFSVFI